MESAVHVRSRGVESSKVLGSVSAAKAEGEADDTNQSP